MGREQAISSDLLAENRRLAKECGDLLQPNPDDLYLLPFDPYLAYTFHDDRATEYHQSLGYQTEDGIDSEDYLQSLADFIEDSLRQWPINGLTVSSALLNIARYIKVVEEPCDYVLDFLYHLLYEADDDTFRIFPYVLGRKQKSISMHPALEYHQLRGDKPAFGYNHPGLPFDFIILDPHPQSYLKELKAQGAFDFFLGCFNDRFNYPAVVSAGLRHLDYVLLHRSSGGGELATAGHPSTLSMKYPNGICIPTDPGPWLNQGQIDFMNRDEHLSVPHESLHAIHDVFFRLSGQLGGTREYQTFNLESLCAQRHHWDNPYTQWLTDTGIPRHRQILLGKGWQRFGLDHNSEAGIQEAKELLLEVAKLPNGRYILEQTRNFLQNYLR